MFSLQQLTSWSGLNLDAYMSELSGKNQGIALRLIKSYSPESKNYIDKLGYVVFCVANAVKSIFGRSDWQVAVKTIATNELKRVVFPKTVSKSTLEEAERIRIHFILKAVLMSREEPVDSFGYDFEIQNTVCPGLHQALRMVDMAAKDTDADTRDLILGHWSINTVKGSSVTYWRPALIPRAYAVFRN